MDNLANNFLDRNRIFSSFFLKYQRVCPKLENVALLLICLGTTAKGEATEKAANDGDSDNGHLAALAALIPRRNLPPSPPLDGPPFGHVPPPPLPPPQQPPLPPPLPPQSGPLLRGGGPLQGGPGQVAGGSVVNGMWRPNSPGPTSLMGGLEGGEGGESLWQRSFLRVKLFHSGLTT